MAKQRRINPSSPVRSKPSAPVTHPQASPAPATRALPLQPPRTPAPPAKPAVRAAYLEAVAIYEQGVAALQEHDYARASSILRSVLSRYPEEKELHERVRLYLNVCDRHMTPAAASPSTPEERVFAATLAFNAGDYDEALRHLRVATEASRDNDHALYMLATVLTLGDKLEEAVPHLLRAIELNPENRGMARHDPDLEALRHFDAVRAALEAVIPAKIERRKAPRRAR